METPNALNPQAVVEKARRVIEKVRPGETEGRRPLPIRAKPGEIRALWADEGARAAVLDGLPVAEASIDVGDEVGDWGTVVTLRLRLALAVPGMATQALAGKAVRRLKSLAETGEVPTTEHNPSARVDAGEATS